MSLPIEVLQEIFNCLDTGHDGLRTLYSCLLVNRLWCSNIVKILWSKPFYYANSFEADLDPYKIIDTYLACLDEEVREDLRNHKVNLPIIYKKPLFAYGSYHKHLYYRNFISCAYIWVQEKRADCDVQIIIKTLLKLFNERYKKIQGTIYIVESTITPMFYVQSVHEYLFSNVNRIWVDYPFIPRFFELLAKNCKKVEQFGVFMKDMGRYNESLSNDVAKFITEQEALQSFQSVYLISTQNIIDALETQARSLVCVDFICANFHDCYSLDGLVACTNLETLRFRKCYNITEELVSQLFMASFPKLRDVSVINTDCGALQIWAEGFNNSIGEFGKTDNFYDNRTQFDLNHVRELMLDNKNKTCLICGEPYIFPLTTTCGHTFCKECITHRLNIYGRCPLKQCRTELSHIKEFFYEHPSKPTDPIILEERRLEADKRSLQEMPIYIGHLVFPKMTYSFKVTKLKDKLLIGSCLESCYHKKFGMLLSKRCEYGTLMEIKRIDFNNEGDLILQATATERFKILSNILKDGYEVAKIQIVEDKPNKEEDKINHSSILIHEPTTSQLIKVTRDFINGNELVSLMLRLREITSSLGEIPDNAVDFSFHVALILPVKDEEKYELLGKQTVKERMQLIVRWINYLRSQWRTLLMEQVRDTSNLHIFYSRIISFFHEIWINYSFSAISNYLIPLLMIFYLLKKMMMILVLFFGRLQR